MKKQTTVLALILALAFVLVPTTYAAPGEPAADLGFDVLEWITDGLDALWNAVVEDDGPSTDTTAGEEAAGDGDPNGGGSDELGPELVPIG